MKKLISILALASVFSIAMMGCQPQAEGDTAQPTTEGGQAPATPTPAPTTG